MQIDLNFAHLTYFLRSLRQQCLRKSSKRSLESIGRQKRPLDPFVHLLSSLILIDLGYSFG
jgi:hypothetical protein